MFFHRPLIIHKSVWEKLKRHTDPQEKSLKQNEKYLKELTEISQTWIKAWPDSVEGHIKKLREAKKKQYDTDLALIRERKKVKINKSRTEEVKKARKMLFDDSCYGKQLISSLIESKTLEERDAQLLFQKKCTQESIDHEKSTSKLNCFCTFNLDANHEKIEVQNKMRAIECVIENKFMQEEKEKETKKNLKQQKEELKILEHNENQQGEYIKVFHASVKDYEIEQEKNKERRKQQDELNDALVKVHAKEKERRKCKIQQVLYEINKDKRESEKYKHVYKIIGDSQETHNNRYQFIDDRIKSMEHQDLKKDRENLEKSNLKRQELQAICQFNKIIEINRHNTKRLDKIVCDAQCLIPSVSCEDKRKKSLKHAYGGHDDIQSTKATFVTPQKKLVDELKNRTKSPSAWSGTKAAHSQFVKVAEDTIQECKYKNLPRKVVDNYRKLHNLDSKTLLVSNY